MFNLKTQKLPRDLTVYDRYTRTHIVRIIQDISYR